MNLGELRNLIRVSLDDNSYPYLWSDEFIDASLNRAVLEASLRMGGTGSGSDNTLRVQYSNTQRKVHLDSNILSVLSVTAEFTVSRSDIQKVVNDLVEGEFDSSVGAIYSGATTGVASASPPSDRNLITRHLMPTTHLELERTKPLWDDLVDVGPTHYILTENGLELFPRPTESGVLTIGANATPQMKMVDDEDEPPLAQCWHHPLAAWVRYEAYRVQDADLTDDTDSAAGLAEFNATFGARPSPRYLRALKTTPKNVTIYQRRI